MKLSNCVIVYKMNKSSRNANDETKKKNKKQRKTEKNQFCHKIKSHDATFIIMPCQVKNEMAQTC